VILLTFFLNGVQYALDVEYVEEVIPLPAITSVAKLPPFFRGMINLRGTAVPVMDLRLRLGLPAAADALETDIVVMKVAEKKTGLIVDKVLNVIEIQDAQCLPPPEFHDEIDLAYIAGVVQIGADFVSLIRLDALLAPAQTAAGLQPGEV